MKPSILADICCPLCGGLLEIEKTEMRGENIVEGSLQCVKCSYHYPIHKGIPYLITENGWGESKEPEMKGWVNLWNKKGMYDIPGPSEDSFKLPYLGGMWREFADMFDLALEELDLKGHEVVLDLGAGQGWASRHFAQKGCKVVAVDIVTDEWWGLGRSWAIMEYAGVYFEPIVADGENLPFFPEKFDVIFLSATLHHFDKLDRVLAQIYRALKPNGRLVAASEPAISVFQKERDVLLTLEETKEGIIERRPKTFQYWSALKHAGFKSVHIDTFETYRATPAQVYNWIRTVRHNHYRAMRSLFKLAVWLVFSLALMLPYSWASWFVVVLNGGNLLIRATKPPTFAKISRILYRYSF